MPTQYFCAQYLAYTLPEAVAASDTIVYGEITDIKATYEESYADSDNTQIFTPMEITPIEALKGRDSTVIYRRLGGVYQGTLYRQEGDNTQFKRGQKVVGFLNEYGYDINPIWFMIENNGTIRYQPDPASDFTTIPTEEFLSLIREALASTEERQDP